VLGAKGGCILVACRSCIFEELLKKRKWIGFREEERSLTKTSSYQVRERERERERELHGPERERCAPFGIPKFGREEGEKKEFWI
jgi:hypothetical protein